MEAVQSRSRETEEKLLSAAERLLEQFPFESVSIALIARAAGASVGGVYARFESKEALLRTLFRRYELERTAFFEGELDEAKWAGADLEARVRGVCAAIVHWMRKRRGLLRAFLLWHWTDATDRDEAFDRRLSSTYNAAAALIAASSEEVAAVDPNRAIHAALAIMIGACRDIIVMKPPGVPGRLEAADKELVDHLTRAMLGILKG